MTLQTGKSNPKYTDFEFTWVTREFGPQWEQWRVYATEWLATQHVGVGDRLHALRAFFRAYLHGLRLCPDPSWLLRRTSNIPDFFETSGPHSAHGMRYGNCMREFLPWVLEQHFSEPDDYGRPVVLSDYHNPFPWRSRAGMVRPWESVHSPLPYRYIRELSEILAPGLHFRDWTCAQETMVGMTKGAGTIGDWFQVREQDIDREDLDCVWRRRNRDRREILEIWSPVRSVALLVKLMLPLRTHQVRMLDSGEADTWRYTSVGWVLNKGSLASGNERRPVRRGVFRRIEDRETGTTLAGLYVNTNKTADTYNDGNELGYVIPWQHDRLLYWL